MPGLDTPPEGPPPVDAKPELLAVWSFMSVSTFDKMPYQCRAAQVPRKETACRRPRALQGSNAKHPTEGEQAPVTRTLRRHRPLLLNYFEAKKQFTNSIVERLKLKTTLK
jgi:hypothetical protein